MIITNNLIREPSDDWQKNLDRCDYILVISTLTNLALICLKMGCALKSKESIGKSHFWTHIDQRSLPISRTIALLFPGINLLVKLAELFFASEPKGRRFESSVNLYNQDRSQERTYSMRTESEGDSVVDLTHKKTMEGVSKQIEICEKYLMDLTISRETQDLLIINEINKLLLRPNSRPPIERLNELKAQLSTQKRELLTPPCHEWPKIINDHFDLRAQVKASEDLGGHGGTIRVRLTIDEKTIYLFLKPEDPTEARNYKILQHLTPDFAKLLPSVHGRVEVNGIRYLVMENTCIDREGQALKPIADIKLAGIPPEAPKNYNPIANQNEYETTRDRRKNSFDYKYMGWTARQARGLLRACDKGLGRWANYGSSERTLFEDFSKLDLSTLEQMLANSETFKEEFLKTPVAFIGLSLFPLISQDGRAAFLKGIDPAHMQISPRMKPEVDLLFEHSEEDKTHVFYGTESEYSLQRESNLIALNSLSTLLQSVIESKSPPALMG